MKSFVLWLLAAYRRGISPLLPAACRFTPTSSEYAQEAIERHGVAWGVALAAGRLLRCHPLCRGGWDPAPHAHARPTPATGKSL